MCAACLEFIKDKLTLNEFQNALKEATSNDPEHLDVIKTLIDQNRQSLDKLKSRLKTLNE